MSVAANITQVIASVNINELLIRKKFLLSYPDVVNYLLKKFAKDKAIVKIDSKLLRYIQTAHMTPIQYVDDLYSKSCKIADFFVKFTLNNNLIEEVDPSICQSPREYWATHPQADLFDIAFKLQSLLAIQKGATKPANTKNQAASSKTYGKRT